MRTLVIIRHGKSSWANPELNDRERPLKKRGYADADLIIEELKKMKFETCKALSSPAKRAHTTAKLITSALDISLKVEERLYFQGENEIIHSVQETEDSVKTLFCFGHEPSLSGLVSLLTDNGIDHIPTTGVAIMDFSIENWSSLAPSVGKCRALLFPKMFR